LPNVTLEIRGNFWSNLPRGQLLPELIVIHTLYKTPSSEKTLCLFSDNHLVPAWFAILFLSNMNGSKLCTSMPGDHRPEPPQRIQSRLLVALLAINASMFLIEAAIGWFAQSTALLADSLDMLADAAVFAIALLAVGRSARFKTQAAFSTGVFQLVLGLAVAVDVLRRFFYGSEPKSFFMVGIGLLALSANLLCMALLQKHRSGEVHIRASWIFTKNDALANLGTVIGGVLVSLTKSALPDLVLGLIICAVVVRAGIEIICNAHSSEPHEAISEESQARDGRS
jgi:Co/Zn/Cd efflux system component